MRPSYRWMLRIAGFLVMVGLADGLAQAFRLKYWMPGVNDRSLNVYVYQKEDVTPDVLIIGTSQILRGLDPELIDRSLTADLGRPTTSYSVCQLGVSCFANSVVFSDVVASNGSPRVVVFGASPSSLNANNGNIPKALRYYCSLSDLMRAVSWMTTGSQWNGAAHGAFRGFANLALYGRHVVLPDQQRWMLNRLAKGRGRIAVSSREPLPRLSDLSAKARREKFYSMRSEVRFRYMSRFCIGGAPEAGLLSSCRLARDRGIRMIIVNPPVTAEYRRLAYPPQVALEYSRFIEEVITSEHVDFVDLDRGVVQLTEDDFMDFSHLNAVGAAKLSRYVATEVLAPILRSGP